MIKTIVSLLMAVVVLFFSVWSLREVVKTASVLSNFPVASQDYVPVEPSPSKAKQAVLDEGYTDVVSEGPPFLGCGQDDSLLNSERFTAKNQNGKELKLVSCCGWFKGCTVRHE